MAGYTIESLVPFNPVDKRTSATVVTPQGQRLVVAKGAPQVPAATPKVYPLACK